MLPVSIIELRGAIVAGLFAVGCSHASAETLDLQCKSSAGGSFSLEIDLVSNVLTNLPYSYPVVDVTPEQITAVGRDNPNGKSGGTVWVIDRVSGSFVMSAAGWFCDDSSCKSTHLDSWVLEGICQKTAF